MMLRLLTNPPKKDAVALISLIALEVICTILWIYKDHGRMLKGDCYLYMRNLVEFTNMDPPGTVRGWLESLSSLSVGGRPPGYQILTLPFIKILGLSEDAFLCVNLVFLLILILSIYKIGSIVTSPRAGLLAAVLVVSYSPIVHLSRTYLPHFAVPCCVALSLWSLLSVLKNRSIASAWIFSASLVLGLMVHPLFAFVLAIPSLVFGTYSALFLPRSNLPSRFRDVLPWFTGKIKDPFVLFGLLPSVILCLGLTLPWYLTKGLTLFDFLQKELTHGIEDFRGPAKVAVGFYEIEPSFWWYAKTAPGALSNFFAVVAFLAFVLSIVKWRLPVLVLNLTLATSFIALSSRPTYWWVNFSAVLPVVACLSATWILELEQRRARRLLFITSVIVSMFSFYFVTFEERPWSRHVASSLRFPSLRSEMCHSKVAGVLCPSPPVVPSWPVREIYNAIFNNAKCMPKEPCELLFVYSSSTNWQPRLQYYLSLDRVQHRLKVSVLGSRRALQPYNLPSLLQSDFVLYPDIEYKLSNDFYFKTTVEFLQSPSPAFDDAHEKIAGFEYPHGLTVLLKRTRPLGILEAESSIAKLELRDAQKSRKFEVLLPLYAQNGRFEKILDAYRGFKEFPELQRSSSISHVIEKTCQLMPKSELAVPVYRESLKMFPSNLWCRLGLSKVLEMSGDLESSVTELQAAIRSSTSKLIPMRRLAKIFRSQGKLDQAIELYKGALEIKPVDLYSRILLSEVYVETGDYDSAIVELDTAVRLNPGKAWPFRRLAEVYRLLGNHEQSSSLYRRAVKLDPNNVWGHIGLAEALSKTGEPNEALSELQIATSLAPENPLPRRRIASIYRRLTEQKQAP